MADEQQGVEPEAAQAEEEGPKTFTQDEVNRIVGREKAKFKDYSELKKKAKAFDELQERSKTDLERAEERAAKAEGELERLRAAEERRGWVRAVSEDTGVPASVLSHMDAQSEDELRAIADEIKGDVAPKATVVVENDGRAADREPRPTAADWMRSTLPRKYQH